jgi:exopolyphosphatase/guanosine-5'-triphosphate,3'-diphosphate pyrophosphatase
VRLAAIDIGTNSIHMVIVRAVAGSSFEVLDREREVVQVGRGSFTTSRLRSDAVRRTVEALARFVQLARRAQVDRILCTATAAVREAKNGGEFLAAARKASGITPRVIPVSEEGRLAYLAVRRALQLDDQPALVVDIGGGGMQLAVGTSKRLLLTIGAPVGALRLTELVLAADPPTRREIQELHRLVRREAREAIERAREHHPGRVYGSSGSIHALAQVSHWQEHGMGIEHMNGHVLALPSLQRLTRQLARMTERERQALRGLDASRAEIILPGALVLEHVLEEVGAEAITISDFGVREGLVTDYLESHAAEISALDAVPDLKLRSVLGLLHKFHADGPHPDHVAKLSLQLFDGLAAVHQMGNQARELLHYAALLHDIGSAIGYGGHGEHSRYIVLNGNLRGLSPEQLGIIATVAKFHGSARPRKRDAGMRRINKAERRVVRWLAAFLRVAEGLDRSHYQLVREVRVRRRGTGWAIEVMAGRDAQLELWAGQQRVRLLERLLDAPVRLRLVKKGSQRAAPLSRRPDAGRPAPAAASPRPARRVGPGPARVPVARDGATAWRGRASTPSAGRRRG